MNWKEWIAVAVVAVLLLILRQLGRRRGQDTRFHRLTKQYAVMTQETIDNAPEGELIDGVVSVILSKAEEMKRPDPIVTLAGLSNDHTVVYAVWVVCKELAVSDYATMMKTKAKDLADLMHNAFTAIGAVRCADAWQTLYTAEEKTADMEAILRLAIQSEGPLVLCEQYIRDNAQSFIGNEE